MGSMRVERLDHLGIVAGICREIGLAEYLDELAGPTQQQVSVGTATVDMILNGLGHTNVAFTLQAYGHVLPQTLKNRHQSRAIGGNEGGK